MDQIPYRFRLNAFQRFEGVINMIITRYPSVVTFNPKDLNMNAISFSCRLRDAMKAMLTYHWPSSLFGEHELRRIYDDIVVSERGHLVIAGSRVLIKTPPTDIVSTNTNKERPETPTINSPSYETLLVLADLAAKRYLAGPLRLTGVDVMVSGIEASFDVVFKQDGDAVIMS